MVKITTLPSPPPPRADPPFFHLPASPVAEGGEGAAAIVALSHLFGEEPAELAAAPLVPLRY